MEVIARVKKENRASLTDLKNFQKILFVIIPIRIAA
jgi:hypothetical protein